MIHWYVLSCSENKKNKEKREIVIIINKLIKRVVKHSTKLQGVPHALELVAFNQPWVEGNLSHWL